MKKTMKSFLSFLLVFSMLHSLAFPAIASINLPVMQPGTATSVHTSTLFFPETDATGAFIVHTNGELWVYIAGLPNDQTAMLSSKVMDDIIAVSFFESALPAGSFFTGRDLFTLIGGLYNAGLAGLALSSDGTLWFVGVGINRSNLEIYVKTIEIDSGVSQIFGNNYLKENGDLYSVNFVFRANSRIVDFARINVYVHFVLGNVVDVIGISTGNQFSGNIPFDGRIIFVRDRDGRLWQWGDPIFNFFTSGISFSPDGSLRVRSINNRTNEPLYIILPVKRTDVMGYDVTQPMSTPEDMNIQN
ncbi:MAG: hypothetical protein FWC95_07405 [Defluviitaleaceae bacterium]|nr:hypothetical protein [Defluviitaleaceae bacterium]